MPSQSLSSLVDELVLLKPDSTEAEAVQRTIEGLLMGALASGGRKAGEKLVESLDALGYPLTRLDALPCMWRLALPPPRVLEMWFTGGDDPVVAALSYREGKPWGSKQQQRAAKRQAAFYEQYERLNPEGGNLSSTDRLIQLVAELEADVNNGGFGQYLDNKGESRARQAVSALATVGAKRTHRWLTKALEASDNDLERLDRQFLENGEDLPSMVMAHIEGIAKSRRK